MEDVRISVKVPELPKASRVNTLPRKPRTFHDIGFRTRDLLKRSAHASPMTVLIVDDEDDVRELVGTILRREGHRTMLARNGVEAWGHLQQTRPDLVLTDLIMPYKDGFDLIWEVNRRLPEVSILAMSAASVPLAFAEGSDRFSKVTVLPKPFTRAELLGAIRSVTLRSPKQVGST